MNCQLDAGAASPADSTRAVGAPAIAAAGTARAASGAGKADTAAVSSISTGSAERAGSEG